MENLFKMKEDYIFVFCKLKLYKTFNSWI